MKTLFLSLGHSVAISSKPDTLTLNLENSSLDVWLLLQKWKGKPEKDTHVSRFERVELSFFFRVMVWLKELYF